MGSQGWPRGPHEARKLQVRRRVGAPVARGARVLRLCHSGRRPRCRSMRAAPHVRSQGGRGRGARHQGGGLLTAGPGPLSVVRPGPHHATSSHGCSLNVRPACLSEHVHLRVRVVNRRHLYIVLFFKIVHPASASADSLFRGCYRLSCRFLPMFSAKSEQVRGVYISAGRGALCSVLAR